MAMISDLGDMSQEINAQTNTDDVAILLDDYVNKYRGGFYVFKLQSLCGLQPDSRVITTQKVNYTNLMNKNKDLLVNYEINKAACIRLFLPISITRTYPHAKFIPSGTKFAVSFVGGDLSKPPTIIRGIWDDLDDIEKETLNQ